MEANKKKELLRAIKYTCIAASAGAIQLLTTLVLSLIWPVEVFSGGPVLFYFIGLVLSVIWNLTINRKYTFKSAGNITTAIWLTVAFYAVFTPASLFLQAWLCNGVLIDGWTFTISNTLGLHTIVGTIVCMVLNLGLEYPFQRFIVFKDSIDQTETK